MYVITPADPTKREMAVGKKYKGREKPAIRLAWVVEGYGTKEGETAIPAIGENRIPLSPSFLQPAT